MTCPGTVDEDDHVLGWGTNTPTSTLGTDSCEMTDKNGGSPIRYLYSYDIPGPPDRHRPDRRHVRAACGVSVRHQQPPDADELLHPGGLTVGVESFIVMGTKARW